MRPVSGDAKLALAWPLRRATAFVLAVAALTIASGRIVRALHASDLGPTATALAIIATYVCVYAIEMGVVWSVAHSSGAGFAESVGMRRVPGMARHLAAAVAAGFALRVAAGAYSALMLSQRWLLPGWDFDPTKYFPSTPLGATVLVAVVVIGAPIVEETVFRGVLLPSLIARMGEGRAIALTTVVFAALHLNPFTFAPILLVGWVLAALFVRSRSLWVAIACHSTFNAIGVLLVLLLRGSGVV